MQQTYENAEKQAIVVYDSVSGFTRQYAQWIAQDLNAECVPICDVDNRMLLAYKCVIIGGHVRYENLSHRGKIAGLIEGHDNAVLFVVGASPTADRLAVGHLMGRIYKSKPQFKYVPHFYFQGGLSYERIPGYERFLLKTITAIFEVRLKLNLVHSQLERECLERMKVSFDAANRARTEVLVEYVSATLGCGPISSRT